MFRLISENLSNLGGPMGTESTSINWERFFSDAYDAKFQAEQDYGSRIDNWVKVSDGHIRSPDLGYVMYHINRVEVE